LAWESEKHWGRFRLEGRSRRRLWKGVRLCGWFWSVVGFGYGSVVAAETGVDGKLRLPLPVLPTSLSHGPNSSQRMAAMVNARAINAKQRFMVAV
jgi:hypothetical protein